NLDMQPALGLLGACPASLAPAAGLRAGSAADRLIALVVQWVVGQVTLVDPPPEILVGPVGERVVLPEPAGRVAFDQLGVRARRALLAADAGDPGLGADEGTLERGDLSDRAAVLGAAPGLAVAAGVEHLDLHAEALLEGAPGLHRLLEQDAGVDRED